MNGFAFHLPLATKCRIHFFKLKYWAKRVADHLRANGYEVAEEAPVGGGKTIDIVATRDGRRIAFEIETGKSDAWANVSKCLKAGFEEVVLVAVSAKVRDKISAVIPGRQGVRLLTASALLKRDWR